MTILPIRTIVIGSPDPDESVLFWSRFGYAPVDAAGPGTTLGCGAGAEIVVTTGPGAGPVRGGWDLGPRGLDVYVADIDAASARLAADGLVCGPVAEITVGPVRMRQCAVLGPSGEPVVLVESTHRRPSLLDSSPMHDASAAPESRWCSEVYSVVWCVESRDAEMQRWSDAGAQVGPPLSFADPSLGAYLALPDAGATLEMATISDVDGTSTRLELLSFPGRRHRPVPADAGVTAIVFADGESWQVNGR